MELLDRLEEINRKLNYLDLSIISVPRTYDNSKEFVSVCNFRRKNKHTYHHILHTVSDSCESKQLNTISDMIINLSENLYKTDQQILHKISKKSESNEYQIILENQNYLRSQLNDLIENVEKTLYKADKFPSKRDIRELLLLPKQVEEESLKILEQFQAESDRNLTEILTRIRKFHADFLGIPIE